MGGFPGALTPVAELEPVFLAGSTISRATLHNEDYIRQKDIRIGDRVKVEKAGEVIPAVVDVVWAARTGKETAFRFPRDCPECGSRVSRAAGIVEGDEGVVWRCQNPDCPAQVRGRLEHWCARGAMDIEGGGEARNRKLIERLRKVGLNFRSQLYQPRAKAGRLAGKTFVLTGTLPTLKREEASAKIEAREAG